MWTSLGSATKPIQSVSEWGEAAAGALERVKAVPVQSTLKQIFTLLLALVLPYLFWHMQPSCSPEMAEISSLEPQCPCAQGRKDALRSSVLLGSVWLKKSLFIKNTMAGSS